MANLFQILQRQLSPGKTRAVRTNTTASHKRDRIQEEVEKEDFLLSQIDEFREKAKQLQDLLASNENKVQ